MDRQAISEMGQNFINVGKSHILALDPSTWSKQSAKVDSQCVFENQALHARHASIDGLDATVATS